SDDKDGKMGIPMAKKKFAELELSLLHLQQNVEIPEIILSIHPAIQRAVEKCRESNKRVTVDVVETSLLGDSSFLNRLQGDVNGWIKEIQKVTKLTRDPASGQAIQEINFWLSMERALERIEEQLKSDPIVLTLDVLKHAKRFHATVSFRADTGLKEGSERVYRYNQLMKDFPLNELLSATDVGKCRDSLILIFGHLNKKLKLSPYPIRRALPLVEAISRDLNDQLLKVLGSRRIMFMEYGDFERAMSGAEEVFRTWDELVKEFTNVAREVTRKRSEKFIPIKINAAHAKLQERMSFVRAFRRQHEQLYQTIVRETAESTTEVAIVQEEVDAVEEVSLAYQLVRGVDVLDVGGEGTEAWVAAETGYNERVARVENLMISRLRDRLGTARNANEMFRVFGTFNALFVRPKIRGAIQEYQTQLIETVKADIKGLHDTFKRGYRHSEAHPASQLRDTPPISGAISWARQIERQLSAYMGRVEAVLGRGWELYAEGAKLAAESASFRRKLDARPMYESWLTEITKRDLSVRGLIFAVSRVRLTRDDKLEYVLELGVNFDTQVITLFKEVRRLLWLGFQVPHGIANVAKDAKRVYPFAVSLMETVRTYSQTLVRLRAYDAKMGPLLPLMAGQQAEVQGMLEKGMGLRWDYFVNTFDTHHRSLAYTYGVAVDARENRHVLFVREFAAIVSALQDKTDALIALDEEVRSIVEGELRTGDYRASTFVDALGRIQKVVDKLSLEGYTNLEGWVEALDERIEEVLLERLETALEVWIDVFERRRKRKEAAKERKKNRGEKSLAPGMLLPSIRVLKHEVRIKHQVMYLDPPLERARSSWFSQLHAWLAIVGHLPRIHGGRYEGGMNVQGYDAQGKDTYGGLLTRLSKDREEYSLHSAYSHMELKLSEVSEYVGVWLQYQSLWDLEANYVFSELGEDLGRWQQILQEIRKARTTFDRSETDKDFGPLLVDYGQVQSKVGAKYDAWQREVLGRYGQLLGSGMRTFHVEVGAARTELEAYSVEASATREAVAFITFVQDLRKRVARWTELVDLYRTGQKVLERQRYQFPSDWVYVDQVEGEWSAFQEILHRKNTAIQEQVAGLQMKIITEDRAVQERIRKVIGEWEEAKPVQGDLAPEMATATLATFEGRVTRLKADYDLVDRAKGALDLEGQDDGARLTAVLEELRDLQGVWRALSEVWARIGEMRETLWSVVVPRKLRQQLEGLLQQTKEMPNRTRQYAAHEFLTDRLRGWVRANALLTDMRSEALRDRHWRQLFKALRVNGGAGLVLSEMTLGQIWDLDLRRNEQTVREVVVQAQGELALEEFLRGVREVWTGYVLELVPYQGKCRLIRGWDDLFAKCAEHQSALAAMRMSPYYRVFEEEAGTWEGKLGRVHALFDVWIDVQRQWVYLEGIFTGSADIKHLLPVETARFQGIHGEFLGVMRRVYSSPFVLDVLGIPGVQKSMERLAEMLAKIQKALGEYLERERSSFPRFYFVGDEDLLEIIGNSKEVSRIQKHMRKMFAGLAGIILEGEDTDDTRIMGMTSKEGEEVRFVRPISLSQYPKINEWLSRLETEMRYTLAVRVGEAVQDLEGFY
ncbi:dync1h1 protein, partial [Piptocephalis cylindrospora]